MFKAYWEMIKSKEGLTSNHVHKLLNKGTDTEYLDINDISEGEESISEFEGENELISDDDDLNKRKKRKGTQKRKSKKRKQSVINKNVKSKKREFSGWGSKLLFDFLASIGKDTEQELSQYDVAAIITRYCNEHKLFHPEKKKKVICDEWLKSLLGRKSVNKNSIHNLLTPHFAENFEQSEDDFGYSSEGKGGNVSMACKRQRNSSPDRKSQNKEAIPDVQRSCFASVIPENINLIYLRRSLVEELSKQPETFDDRVLGSFVRIKCDPYDYSQKNSHQLLKVKGIKRSSRSGEVNTDILLQVFNMPKDIPICKLSDDNFSKEECEDLQQRVSEGRLERPTVVEFKEKAKSLHDVITKHWILKEITLLQNLIDHANEKGWRRELSEYMDRLLLLRTPTEQSRLLHDIPEIIADEAEVETAENDLSSKDEKGNNTSPESACGGMSKPCRKSSSGNRIPSYLNDGANFAEQKQQSEEPKSEEMVKQHHTNHARGGDDFHQTESCESPLEVKQNCSKASHPELISGQLLASIPQGQPIASGSGQKQQSEEPESEEMARQHHTSHASGGEGIHQTESCESALEVKQNHSKASHSKLISGQLLASIPQGQPIASGSGQKQQSEEPESKEMARQHHTSHARGGDGIHQTENCESALEVKQSHSKASHPELVSGQLLASIPQGQPIASGSGLKQQSEEPESEQMVKQHHTSHASGGDDIHQTENSESALEVKQNHSKGSHPELISGQLLASIPQGQPIASGSGLKQQSEEPESEEMVKQHHTSHASGSDDIHKQRVVNLL
ncbi:zinc finger CCCH domain-containing protein 19-like isoform X3 [Hevea brasiliensis]|nr:zinc finger CCCH domain-containing protein 19-like isoform X3 [Hevea brasiliensis]